MTFIADAIIESMFGYQNYNNIYFVTTFESPIHLKVEKNLTTTFVKKEKKPDRKLQTKLQPKLICDMLFSWHY